MQPYLQALLTVDVFLLGWADLLGGRFADGLGKALAGQTVLGGYDSVHKALTGHVRTVKQLVDVHGGFDRRRCQRNYSEQTQSI